MAAKAQNTDETVLHLKKLFFRMLAIYVIVFVSFYFLAGDQLRFRSSRGNVAMAPADAGTLELVQGAVVEQIFQSKIQRLESVSVQFGNYYRENHGTITVELLRMDTWELIMSQDFNASEVREVTALTVTAETPAESVYDVPLLLRVYADSAAGDAVTPLRFSGTDGEKEKEEGFALYLNEEPAEGRLCFSAEGEDYIWTGLHYWEFSAALGLALILVCLVVYSRYRRGKRSYVVNALIAVKKYRFLIRQLVSRDFKTKYKRSILGVFWSFLNPLLMMLVQYFVFSTIFRNDVQNFAVYLLIGVVMFNFFTESCGMTLSSILGNAGLITKVYMPKYIYPLTRTLSSLVNLLISLIPLIIVCLATGVQFQKSAILALYFFACLVVFCLGLGMLLSTSMVFFRDTQFLWNVLSMMWMYATPIFYPEKILPENLRFVLQVNPIYYFLKNARLCILNGISPEPIAYFQCLLIALGMLLVGAFVFYRNQNKFVLYL